ncbi:flavin reductase family protein [Beijerinckia sp. L45]|uniref:flavin reductase family protein n=1 Tax=Beijerinckia sp. L45 TaxID=1641855 RepID=UPI00131E8E99|nr:flavin reductase family protein [Beijerinckia sp. L45]
MNETDRPFTSRDLRTQLGLFPTGVAVITAVTDTGVKLGATVGSFASVSLDPPLVSFNMARSSNAFDAWASVGTFAVNVLSQEQSDVSTRFARALSDKWEGLEPAAGAVIDAPLLPEALAWFECITYAVHAAGDHAIILGEVQCFRRAAQMPMKPLVFFGGKYRRLESDLPIPTPFDETNWIHGW